MALTTEQAQAMAESKWWEDATALEIAQFQIQEELLCMPFGKFHEAVEAVVGRPVWTHELASDHIRKVVLGEEKPSTVEEMFAEAERLFGDKLVVLAVKDGKED